MKCEIVKEIDKVFLSSRGAVKYLGVSTDFMKNVRMTGELHYFQHGGMIWYRKSDLDRFVERSKVV
jgi:hypothetical protein